MDYFCLIQSVVSYVENRLKSEVLQEGLEGVTGFSLSHVRDVFKKYTKLPLGKYILYRRVAHAAFEMVHTQRNLLEIALEYGFKNHDTFTRAFRRVTGVTPSVFRRNRFEVGRIKLTAGMFGPGILNKNNVKGQPICLEDKMDMKIIKKLEDSCILYGMPKVEYRCGECTPFISTLKACLNYMGQDISYSYLMAASGASFRLRWNTTCWNGGNIDIAFIYEDLNEAYKRSFEAAGRSYRIYKREPSSQKEEFMQFIKVEIDEGRPVIALGIIGPPEACIITGYREGGKVLLGWNFFQENPEFAKDVELDQSGYFICKNWWENPDTIAVMSIGEEKQSEISLKEILQNAYKVLTKEKIGVFAGGQAAFDAWGKAVSDDHEFTKDAVLPMLFERLMCQSDAMDMVGEGRHYAADFMQEIIKQNVSVQESAAQAVRYFKEEESIPHKMAELLGGWQRGEQQARRLASKEVRKEIARLIMEAKKCEAQAAECIANALKDL